MMSGHPLEVGHGVYGCVFLGRLNVFEGGACLVAIKLFKKKSSTTEADIMREAAVMQHLNEHKVTPYLFGVTIIDENPLYEQWALVFEFIGDEQTFCVQGKTCTLSLHISRKDSM